MPQPSKLNPPIDLGGESPGQRITRIRKERGFTQVELAEKLGVIQSIVSALERDERKLSAEMAVRFTPSASVWMICSAPARPANEEQRRITGRSYADSS